MGTANNDLHQFNVCIKVIEAKNLPSDISSLVTVEVGEEKKCTKVIKHTNKPYYDEYFVFEIHSDFQRFMNTIIIISVIKPRKKIRFKKLIGCIKFDVGIIWSQRNQRLVEWFPLTIPSDYTAQVMGHLRCEVRIEAPEPYRKSELEEQKTVDSIFGNRVRYRVKIYKCVGLEPHKANAPDVVIRVLYAGKHCETTKRKLRECVEWSEQITFIGTYPPLFHKMSVELVIGDCVIVSKHFYFSEILKFLKGGDQNIFGPNYVHLYKNEFSYKGSLFMAVETESSGIFKESDKLHGFSILPIPKYKFGSVEKFLCFGILFDAMMNGRRAGANNVQLALNFGFTGLDAKDNSKNHPVTSSFKPIPGNSDFCFISLNEQKPCVFICSEWPDYTHRLKNSNIISNVTQNLREAIILVKELNKSGNILEAKEIIKTTLVKFTQDCQESSRKLVPGCNDLDIGRIEHLTRSLNSMLPKLALSCIEEKNFELVLKKVTSILNIADELSKDLQESLPSIVLSLKNNKTEIGSSKIDPRHILFDKRSKKRGCDCGKIKSVLIRSSNKLEGRIDIWLWLGFWDDVPRCIEEFPPGHENLLKMVALPPFITYDTYERYTIFCRIYSGYIEDVLSVEGHCDSFVRVLCPNQSQQTKTVKECMGPVWKETLTLMNIRLYTPDDFNRDNPPFITVEFWNQASNPPKRIGVELIAPSYVEKLNAIREFKLQWLKIENKARILCAFEMVRIDSVPGDPFAMSTADPAVLDPDTVPYRLEVVFWGIRPVDVEGLNQNINRVQVIIQCSQSELKSNVLTQTMNSLNFQSDVHILPLELPRVNFFSPPLILQIISDNKVAGWDIEKNVHRFEYKLPTIKEWEDLSTQPRSLIEMAKSRHYSFQQVNMPDLIPLVEMKSKRRSSSDDYIDCDLVWFFKDIYNYLKLIVLRTVKRVRRSNVVLQYFPEEEDYDWWCGYYSGAIKIYSKELENQSEFNQFNDVLQTFFIKEKKEGRFMDTMKVKTLMCLYQWPSEKKLVTYEGEDPERGILKLTGLRARVKLLIRVYCIRAHDLDPKDPNGLADPYIEIATPSNCISDKHNYIPKQLNPVFGKCFEIPAMLPTDSILAIRVIDWDMFTASDLIGETVIDIENRFYTKHRANCGLPKSYSQTGHNPWRDVENPTEILEKLCNTYNLPLPQYFERSVIVGSKEFIMTKVLKSKVGINERLALLALNRWKEMPIVGQALVPQHVETRCLYMKDQPGIVKGKLELWVDMFDQSLEIPPPIDIKPRNPEPYELRVVVFNTEKIPLVDDSFFVGKKSTDIFVKGWLWDADNAQSTDIHYTSINGSGNFNWRFIFQFLYLKQEKRMVIYRKERFNVTKSEIRVPALLHLQVWDSDRISADDFIGEIVLELCNMPRGSLSVATCKARQRMNPAASSALNVDLFKAKRLRGWWPFTHMTDEMKQENAGYLEAEFHLLTKEEALVNPAGLGRAGPNALPAPIRPSIRIKFWLAPLRALCYVCKANKGRVTLCLVTMLMGLFVIVAIYSVPVFIIKRVVGA